jgi:hypothetical protein
MWLLVYHNTWCVHVLKARSMRLVQDRYIYNSASLKKKQKPRDNNGYSKRIWPRSKSSTYTVRAACHISRPNSSDSVYAFCVQDCLCIETWRLDIFILVAHLWVSLLSISCDIFLMKFARIFLCVSIYYGLETIIMILTRFSAPMYPCIAREDLRKAKKGSFHVVLDSGGSWSRVHACMHRVWCPNHEMRKQGLRKGERLSDSWLISHAHA